MGLFARKHYDRTRILRDAGRARGRGRRKKALRLYRRVLDVEPGNDELLRKVAALYAETGQTSEAWDAYRQAALGMLSRGFLERSIGLLREAASHIPHEIEVWNQLADLELQRNRPLDSHSVLLEGRQHFRARKHYREAVLLLLRARKIRPRHFDTDYDLAGLLARAGARSQAHAILEQLVPDAQPRELRKLRTRQLVMSPTPAACWRWLRARFGRR